MEKYNTNDLFDSETNELLTKLLKKIYDSSIKDNMFFERIWHLISIIKNTDLLFMFCRSEKEVDTIKSLNSKEQLIPKVEEAFLLYVVEEKCKTCASTKKGLCCHEYNECTSMEHEYFVAGYKQFENNKQNGKEKND